MAKSNLEEVTNDILDSMKDDDGKVDDDDRDFIESIKEMILAGNEDIREEIEANETFQVNETMAHHAKSLVVQYAAICVKVGQAAGLLDENGQPTDKMPREIAGFLEGTTKGLQSFKEMYVGVHGEAAWEAMNGQK